MALRATLSRRHSSQRLFVFLVLARRDTEILFYGAIVFLEFGDRSATPLWSMMNESSAA